MDSPLKPSSARSSYPTSRKVLVLSWKLSIHLGETVRELIESAGARLIYLPTYSPDFSPIENCWSKFKSILRAIGARTYPDLAKAIEQAFSNVSLKCVSQTIFVHGLLTAATAPQQTRNAINNYFPHSTVKSII